MRFISILRGINVGGRRKILMSDIKLIYTSLGFSNVITYIQSGNVIFDSDEIPSYIESKLETEIKNIYGFDVPVMVRSSLEIMTIITNNIFVEDENYDIERLNYTFLKIFPDQSQVKHILQYNFEPDKFNISGSGIYGYCSGKSSDTKLTNNFYESKLKVKATTRNWKTMLKLLELSS